MTVVSQTTRVRYSGTSVPAEEYPVTFTFDYAADLEVIHTDSSGTDTTLELTTHYTVSGGSGSTGTVTVTDSDYRAGTGEALTIRLNLDIEQQTDLVDNAALSASVLETQFDRNVRVSQQLQEQIDRCVKVGVTSETDPDDLVNIIETSVVSCAASASAASSSASSASDYADAAAASAASVDLPALEASSMLVSTATPEWEMQTFAEVLTTLGGGPFGIDMFKATTSGAGATLFGLGEAATADLADQATAEAGTDNTDVMTPLRVSQLITALLASEAQAEAGTDNTKLMTPLRVAQAMGGGLNVSIQSESAVAVTTATNYTYSSLGFTPKLVIALAGVTTPTVENEQWSIGFGNASSQKCIRGGNDTNYPDGIANKLAACYSYYSGTTYGMIASIASFGSDSVTITIDKYQTAKATDFHFCILG